jgi:type IV pilus assembly protein PilM
MSIRKWFGSRQKPLVGIDIGSSAVKVAALKSNGSKQFRVDALGRVELPEDTIVDGSIISKLPVAESIERLFSEQRIRNSRIATSISGHSVIVKKVTLPTLSEEELDESIQWEAEQYIPFDLADVNVDYQIVGQASEDQKLEVILVAAKKEKIADYTSVISMAGKIPNVVDIDAFALQNVYEVNYKPEPGDVAALLNIGSSLMNIIILNGSEFLFTRDIAIGGHQYTEFLQEELGLTLEEAEQYKRGIDVPEQKEQQVVSVLNSVSENLSLEIERTFDYFKTTTYAQDIQRMYICGGASQTKGLREFLGDEFQLPVEFLDPFKKLQVGKAADFEESDHPAADFAIAVGLALRTTNDR